MAEQIGELYKKVNTRNQATWLTYIEEHLMEIKAGPYNFSHRVSYNVRSHRATDKAVQEKYHQAKAGHPFRREEWICRLAMGKTFGDPIGTIIDYQVPLKATVGIDDSGLGKIDLLTRNGDTVLYIQTGQHPLELKYSRKAAAH